MTFRIVLAALACALTTPALAQTAPDPDGDIVITGRKAPDRPTAERFVGAISVRSGDQLARFHQPVCPLVIGLPAYHAGIVQDRIREDAKAIGLEVAKSNKCDANLIVVIAGNGANLVKDIRINRPGWLEGLTPGEIDRLIEPGPVRAWSVTSLRNGNGQGLYTPPLGSGAGQGDAPVMRVMTASIIAVPTRSDLEAGFVVIDQGATIGLSLRQIADYAAMRGFARTKSPGDAAVGTILTLFDPAATARARSLTDVDLSYLRALYSNSGERAAVTERAAIARRIAKPK